MSFFIVVITAAGLGHFFCLKKGDFFKMPGLFLFAGYMCIPLLLFFCDSIIPGYLNLFSRFIFSISIISLGILIFNNKNDLKLKALHPIWFLIFLCMIAYLFIPCEYQIHAWDEYSHWLLMPKQIYIANTFQSTEFTYKALASYTPGWPCLLNYPIFVYGNIFDIGAVHQVAAFGSIAVIGLIYDAMKNCVKMKMASNYALATSLFITVLLMGKGSFFQSVFPTNLLIEIPLSQIIFSCFMVLYMLEINPKSWKKFTIILSVLLASGYLIKKTFIIVFFFAVINYSFIIYKIHEKNLRSKLINLLTILVPCLAVVFIWRYRCMEIGIGELFDLSVKEGNSFLNLIISEKSQLIIYAMIREILKEILFNIYSIPAICFAILILKKKKIGKLTFYSLILLIIFYVVSLYWTYLTGFGKVVSFKRYIYIILKPLSGLAFCVCFLSFWERYHDDEWSPFFYSKKFYIVITAIFVFMIYSSITKINNEHVDSMSLAFKKIYTDQQLDRNENNKLLLISQNSHGLNLLKLRYFALGKDLQLYPHYSFAEKKSSVYTVVLSKSDMIKKISSSNTVLIWKSNQWMNNILRTNFNISQMDDYSKTYLTIKNTGIIILKKLTTDPESLSVK
ncbi:MAG: hypothetical protein GY760_19075 [Deltaproteobacteria bacterium]|nr:hypothetical protein [Deltaproteobacteria bacterium]